MRKAIYLLTTLMVFFVLQSCTDEMEIKRDWTVTVKTVLTATPAMEGYPVTTEITQVYNDKTENEIKAIVEEINSTTSMNMGAVTITTTITATYQKK